MTDPTPPSEPQWITIPPVPDRVREGGIGAIVAVMQDAIDELREQVEALQARVETLEGGAP